MLEFFSGLAWVGTHRELLSIVAGSMELCHYPHSCQRNIYGQWHSIASAVPTSVYYGLYLLMICSSEEAQVRKGSKSCQAGLYMLHLLYEALAEKGSSLPPTGLLPINLCLQSLFSCYILYYFSLLSILSITLLRWLRLYTWRCDDLCLVS